MKLFIEYLKDNCQQLDFIESMSIIGSTYQKTKIAINDEIDLYVVLNISTPEKINTILALLKNTKNIFGKVPYIETRRGPFRNKKDLQLHVIIDDLLSISYTSAITLADWNNNSLLIKGVPLENYVKNNLLRGSFRYEIRQTLNMLLSGKIQFKKWIITKDGCYITERIQNISSVNEYYELLKYSYKAMKNDYIALSNLGNNIIPEEKNLEKFTNEYRIGKTASHNLQQIKKQVIRWNYELLSNDVQ